MKFNINDKVLFVHPKNIIFNSGIIIAKIESRECYIDQPKGRSYMIELNKGEIRYVEERLVFANIEDAKENIFNALK